MNDEATAYAVSTRRRRFSALLVFLFLFISFAYFFHEDPGWNVNSRICLTYAMVERGTFQIDYYQQFDGLKTEDIAQYEGHYYSDKIIGTSLLGAIPMVPLHLVSLITGVEFSWDTKRYIVRTFSVSILAAATGVVLYYLILVFGGTNIAAVLLALLFFFGTQMFSVSTVFLSYAPAVFFFLLSYALIVARRDSLDSWTVFLAGLALGTSLLCEYTVGIVALGLSVYLLYHLRGRWYYLFIYWAGTWIPLLLFVGYTLICFGEVAIPYKYLVREEFRQGMSQGFQGITGFNPAVLYFITIHRYRGLFYHSPFLVPAIWGWVVMWRTPGRRSDAALSICMIVGYLIFNSSYYMWWGGWTNGPRHLIPALPFLIIPLWWVWRAHWTGKVAIVVLAFLSVFWNALPAMVDAQIRQGYQAFQLYNPSLAMNYQDPLWHFGIRQFLQGNLAVNAGKLLGLRGLWSLVPLGVVLSALAAATVPFLRTTRNGECCSSDKASP